MIYKNLHLLQIMVQ